MKQLLELIPLLLFFVAYQYDGRKIELLGFEHTLDGIFSATAVLMIATGVHVVVTRALGGKLEKRLIWTAVAVLTLGAATLAFRDERFIQWKPTVVNWVLMLLFAGSQFVGRVNLVERIMGSQIQLPSVIWVRVCWLWSVHFFAVGALNILIAYRYSEAFWVSYKLWSAVGFTVLLVVLTTAIISPHLSKDMKHNNSSQ